MSISEFLGKYPRAVLSDERNVLLLSVLERQGASTEQELAHVMGIDAADVASRLIPLFSNELVAVDHEVLHLTHLGKTLVDRFSVGDAVVADLLGNAGAKHLSESLQRLLLLLRSYDYGRYLTSLRAQRVAEYWMPPAELSVAGWTSLALLLRDVTDWSATSSAPSVREASTTLKHAVYEFQVRDVDPSLVEDTSRGVWLFSKLRPDSDLTDSVSDLSPPSAIEAPMTSQLARLVELDEMQRRHSVTRWLRATCPSPAFLRAVNGSPNLFRLSAESVRRGLLLDDDLDERQFMPGDDPVRLELPLIEHEFREWPDTEERNRAVAEWEALGPPQLSAPDHAPGELVRSLTDVLSGLYRCRTVEEFAEAAGIGTQDSERRLQAMHARCAALLTGSLQLPEPRSDYGRTTD